MGEHVVMFVNQMIYIRHKFTLNISAFTANIIGMRTTIVEYQSVNNATFTVNGGCVTQINQWYLHIDKHFKMKPHLNAQLLSWNSPPTTGVPILFIINISATMHSHSAWWGMDWTMDWSHLMASSSRLQSHATLMTWSWCKRVTISILISLMIFATCTHSIFVIRIEYRHFTNDWRGLSGTWYYRISMQFSITMTWTGTPTMWSQCLRWQHQWHIVASQCCWLTPMPAPHTLCTTSG